MAWHSRKVLSWRTSNTVDVVLCVKALSEVLEKSDAPEVFNTDQGYTFTATSFTKALVDVGVAIGMDGRGRVDG